MINNYIKEFLAIVKYLIKSELVIEKDNFLIVDKEIVFNLLEKNLYQTKENKLKIWRGLNWIDTDKRRFTKRVKLSGKESPKIKIRYEVYKTLEKLNGKERQ